MFSSPGSGERKKLIKHSFIQLSILITLLRLQVTQLSKAESLSNGQSIAELLQTSIMNFKSVLLKDTNI